MVQIPVWNHPQLYNVVDDLSHENRIKDYQNHFHGSICHLHLLMLPDIAYRSPGGLLSTRARESERAPNLHILQADYGAYKLDLPSTLASA